MINCAYCKQMKAQVKKAKFNGYKFISIMIKKKDKLCSTHRAMIRKMQ
jgi:hypothetical protein